MEGKGPLVEILIFQFYLSGY